MTQLALVGLRQDATIPMLDMTAKTIASVQTVYCVQEPGFSEPICGMGVCFAYMAK